MDKKTFSKLKRKKLGVCFVSSYPPRECGIATFTVFLKEAVKKNLPKVKFRIIAIDEPKKRRKYTKRVIKVVRRDNRGDYIEAAKIINKNKDIDIVSVQHVFSLFGGNDGELILEFLKRLRKPCVTTMHMVYQPTKKPHKFEIVETNFVKLTKEIVKYSDKIVVMIEPVKDLLVYKYKVPRSKVIVIAHGLPEVARQNPKKYKKKLGFEDKKLISTFGLIRQKKGLEYVIYAMPKILKKYPETVFLILGDAHPARPRSYYEFLKKEVKRLNLEKKVIFHEHYLTYKEIIRYLLASDIFVTPYVVPEQTSSGVVSFALGCGKAIIATKFLYAKDVLAEERGVLVNFRNLTQIFEKVDYLFSHPKQKEKMEKRAYQYGQTMIWEEVAQEYIRLFFKVLKK